ncbi:MAG: hypothetical protein ACXWLM_08965 [Myxococcales bacterium]
MAFKNKSALVRVIEGALPDELVRRARRAIARLGSERMRESYFTTFWLPRDAAPANVIEEAVLALAKKARVRAHSGMEWWIGRAYADRMPIEFHFDHDVKGGKLRQPIVSSVFFFNSVRGGQLAITDQTPRKAEADRLETVKPRRNRYALFAGKLFHGVLAGPGERLRVTLVVNYWRRRPAGVPGWAESSIYRALR